MTQINFFNSGDITYSEALRTSSSLDNLAMTEEERATADRFQELPFSQEEDIEEAMLPSFTNHYYTSRAGSNHNVTPANATPALESRTSPENPPHLDLSNANLQTASSSPSRVQGTWERFLEHMFRLRGWEGGKLLIKLSMWAITFFTAGVFILSIYVVAKGYDSCHRNIN